MSLVNKQAEANNQYLSAMLNCENLVGQASLPSTQLQQQQSQHTI